MLPIDAIVPQQLIARARAVDAERVNDDTRLITLDGHSEAIHSLACSPDGKTLATGSLDKTVALWDVDTGHDLMIWYLQHIRDSSQNTGRIAVAQGADITNQQWSFYDFTPQSVGGWSNEWFDFPDLALSDNFLYLTTNAFATTGGGGFTRAVILRVPLDQLAGYQALSFDYFDTTQDFSLRPTAGATDTMYFGSHVTTSMVRIHEWPENANILTAHDVAVQLWSNASRVAVGPDGRPWLGRSDPRITAAWAANGSIGFGWSAAQDASFDFPHVRFAVIDTGGWTVTTEPHLWNTGFAYAYPAAAPNADGAIGISVAFGGGSTFHPGVPVGTFDEATETWQLSAAVDGTHGPTANKWGDYLTVRPDPANPQGWYATGFTLQGGPTGASIEPALLQFQPSGGVSISLTNLGPDSTLEPDESTTIRATVTESGVPSAGQNVSFSVDQLLTLSATSGTTDSSGIVEITATAQSDGGGTATVTASSAGVSDTLALDVEEEEPPAVPDLSHWALLVLAGAMVAAALRHARR